MHIAYLERKKTCTSNMSGKPTVDAIKALLAQSPYSTSNQAQLEAFVDAQAAGTAPYDMDANRSLLKIYQFVPQNSNQSKIAMILLLSLLEFPSTDCLALSYLLPEKLSKVEPIASILHCASLLDSCKFDEFWKAYGGIAESDGSLKSLLDSNKGTERLQRAVVNVLALSYRTAPLATVLNALNVKSGGDISKLSHPNVESVTAETVSFAPTADNTKRNRVFQEGVNFSAIASMMARVTSE